MPSVPTVPAVPAAIFAASAAALAEHVGLPAALAAPSAAAPGAAAPAAAAPSSASAAAATPYFPISATDNEVLIGPKRKSVSYKLAFNEIAKATERVRSQSEVAYAQLRGQGQGWYRLSLLSATVGFGIIALAVVALLFGHTKTGLVTTASSVVPNAVATLFFVQARRADIRLDAIGQNLTELREKYELIEMANSIEDSLLRDALKAEIVRKVLTKGHHTD